jgi:hypothetical protein
MKKLNDGENYIDLNCIYSKSKKEMTCDTSKTLTYGQYNFYDYDNTFLETHTFISKKIGESDIHTDITKTHIGSNKIRFISTNFYMPAINKVVIKDNFSKIITYEKNNLWSSYVNIVSNTNNNYIDVTFTAHPNKTYTIKLFTAIGYSKEFEFYPEFSTIEISFNKKYHIMNLETAYLPKITFSNGYFNEIERVYYKNIKTNKYNNYFIGSITQNKKVFTYRPNEHGIFKFSYSLASDHEINKYDILKINILLLEELFLI